MGIHGSGENEIAKLGEVTPTSAKLLRAPRSCSDLQQVLPLSPAVACRCTTARSSSLPGGSQTAEYGPVDLATIYFKVEFIIDRSEEGHSGIRLHQICTGEKG